MKIKYNLLLIETILALIILLIGLTNGEKQAKTVTLVIEVNDKKREIVLELFWSSAPKTCKNFVELAKKKYYNKTIFHRIIKGFMIQGGDPTGTGTGGHSIYGEKFADEFDPKLKHDREGTLSMANAGPDTNGSQFFITLVPTPHLNGIHTIFGRVKKGLDVLREIGNVKTGQNDKPLKNVQIIDTKIEY